jgi:AmmeMemoRadiSam system protein A
MNTTNDLDTPALTGEEKHELLRLARDSLISYFSHPRQAPKPDPGHPGLLQKSGAFVTLHRRNGALQGCIGRIDNSEPLYKVVQECAVSAATRDFRFTPIAGSAELEDIVIEISVLSPFRRITQPEEIKIGRHGLMIRQGMQSGLLLPQVASERNWDRTQFLRAICMKAGLPTDAWRKAELYVFGAEVFQEQTE